MNKSINQLYTHSLTVHRQKYISGVLKIKTHNEKKYAKQTGSYIY